MVTKEIVAVDPVGVVVAIEEMSELIKEISKQIRYENNENNMAEEIADVRVMLDQLEYFYDLKDKIDKIYDEKLERMKDRIKEKSEKQINLFEVK